MNKRSKRKAIKKEKQKKKKQKNLQNEVINSLNIKISNVINNIKKLGGNPKNAK